MIMTCLGQFNGPIFIFQKKIYMSRKQWPNKDVSFVISNLESRKPTYLFHVSFCLNNKLINKINIPPRSLCEENLATMPNLVYLHVLINYAVPYLWDIIVAYRAQIHTANNHTPKINKKCAKMCNVPPMFLGMNTNTIVLFILVIYVQGRIQDRRQPAPGHPLGSLKNKSRMVKNKISFDPNILFIWTGHPYRSFLVLPLYMWIYHTQNSKQDLVHLISSFSSSPN
jgi:hypothetical protein